MTITQALKKLKLLEKKMESNVQDIQKYSSILDSEIPYFGTVEEQKAAVQSLVQSNKDLFAEYLKTKSDIELTNNKTIVSTSMWNYSISWLILIKRGLWERLGRTYMAMNDSVAERKPKSNNTVTWVQTQVVRLYDEKQKNESISKLNDFMSEIDWLLEVVNATTETIE